MIADSSYYLTVIIWRDTCHYFLWRDGGSSHDRFLQRADGTIYFTKNLLEAKDIGRQYGVKEFSGENLVVDLDRLWIVLGLVRKFTYFSKADCTMMLNSWNVLEDLAWTLGINLPPFQRASRMLIQDIYEKIFYCADVLGFRSEASYGLKISRRQRFFLKRFLFTAWKRVRCHRLWFQE